MTTHDDEARHVPSGLRALYASMTTRELRTLRAAFVLDRQRGHASTVAFCDGRIALLDDVLRTRDPDTP